jgi:hypothetical protein
MSPVSRYRGRNGARRREQAPDAPPQGPTPASRTTDQVHEILRAADRQAAEIRREVEEWATTRVRDIEREALRHLDEAKARSDALVAERLDPVLALSAIVEEHAERVIALLEDVEWVKVELRDLVREMREGLQADDREQGPPAAAPAPTPLDVAEPAPPAEGHDDHDDQDDRDDLDDEGVRLLSLQMAMQGSTRADVELKICDEFDVGDPEAILDDVFGAGTPGSHRIAWNAGPGAR